MKIAYHRTLVTSMNCKLKWFAWSLSTFHSFNFCMAMLKNCHHIVSQLQQKTPVQQANDVLVVGSLQKRKHTFLAISSREWQSPVVLLAVLIIQHWASRMHQVLNNGVTSFKNSKHELHQSSVIAEDGDAGCDDVFSKRLCSMCCSPRWWFCCKNEWVVEATNHWFHVITPTHCTTHCKKCWTIKFQELLGGWLLAVSSLFLCVNNFLVRALDKHKTFCNMSRQPCAKSCFSFLTLHSSGVEVGWMLLPLLFFCFFVLFETVMDEGCGGAVGVVKLNHPPPPSPSPITQGTGHLPLEVEAHVNCITNEQNKSTKRSISVLFNLIEIYINGEEKKILCCCSW